MALLVIHFNEKQCLTWTLHTAMQMLSGELRTECQKVLPESLLGEGSSVPGCGGSALYIRRKEGDSGIF